MSTNESQTEFWMVAFCPNSGGEYLRKPWPDDTPMDPALAAEEVANGMGATLEPHEGRPPIIGGDIRVEFRRDPDNPALIYTGESFYFATEHDA